jgi:hypothetical protein
MMSIFSDMKSLEAQSSMKGIASAGYPDSQQAMLSALPLYFEFHLPVNLNDEVRITPTIPVYCTRTATTAIPVEILAEFLFNLGATFYTQDARRSKVDGLYRYWNISLGSDHPPVLRVAVTEKFETCTISICGTCSKFTIVTSKHLTRYHSVFLQIRDHAQLYPFHTGSFTFSHPHTPIRR